MPIPTHKIRSRFSRSFRILKEFDNHEMLIGFTNEKVKLKGYISIHSTQLGPALGGTRLQYYSSEEAAVRDVLNLSKAMSYKCALAGLPWGGGKAVIILDSSGDRREQLAAYAEFVEKLGGLFRTGTDVGIFDEDVKLMAKYTSQMLGVSEGDRGDLSTSKMAALGVFYSIKSCLNQVFKDDSPQGKTVAIKGVGKLGSELAQLLLSAGAKVIIADIDKTKCEVLQRKYPELVISSPDSIHATNADVYSPCALGNELRPRIIKELRAKIIAGGANNQLVDDNTGDKLFAQGILYAPDYIANAGGLIYVADELENDGFKQARVLKRVEGLQETLNNIFRQSNNEHIAPHRIADKIGSKLMGKGLK